MPYGMGSNVSVCPGCSGSTKPGCQLRTQCTSAKEFAQGLNLDPNISNGQPCRVVISLARSHSLALDYLLKMVLLVVNVLFKARNAFAKYNVVSRFVLPHMLHISWNMFSLLYH